MKPSLAVRSLLMFAVSITLLVLFTLADSEMARMPLGTQRLIALAALVIAPGFGSVFGLLSLIRKERRAWLAITGIVFNTLFAGFHLMVILFAG